MVGTDGVLPLPWLAEPLRFGLQYGAHAVLVQGPEGVGQFELALTLAQAWLCEAPGDAVPKPRPCGICPACRLVQAHSHPDLLVLLPEALREGLGWAPASGEGEGAAAEKAGKAKPSKELKVDAVRAAVAFAQTTSARGRGKVLVLHPAERMNAIAANTLLKTLEEPPGDARFLLSCGRADALLPTIRSRCQALALKVPPRALAEDWLTSQGVAGAAVLLAACGGQPLDALEWSEDGVSAALWTQLPRSISRGEAGPFMNWPLPRLVDALQKLGHDALCLAVDAPPRYFPASALTRGADIEAIGAWLKELARIARNDEHPWSAGLLVESLVDEARRALASPSAKAPRDAFNSVHLRP